MHLRFMLLLASLMGVSVAHAQIPDLESLRGNLGGSYTRFAEPGDITIRVSMWGAIGNAGLFEITQGTHLSTLLTIAGGPPIGRQGGGGAQYLLGPGSGRIINEITIRVLRERGGNQWETIFEQSMKDITTLTADPVLEDGDLIILETETRRSLGWRDALSIISAVAGTVFVVDRLVQLFTD